MKKRIISLALALMLLLTACGQAQTTKTGLRASDKPYMVIEGEEITNKQYYAQNDLFANVYALQYGIANQVRQMLLEDAAIKKDLAKNDIEIKDEEYKAALDEAIAGIGGPEEFAKYLDFMGTTEDIFKINIESGLRNEKHLEWYTANHKPTDEEIKSYYEQNKGSLDTIDTKHILVADEKTANEVYDKLQAGEDFATLNETYSTDEAAKARGGELGKMPTMQLDPKYVEAALKLEAGEFSKPVQSQFGYHIIGLNSKETGLESHTEAISEAIANQTRIEYLNDITQALEVDYYDYDGKKIDNEEEETQEQEGDTDKDPSDND